MTLFWYLLVWPVEMAKLIIAILLIAVGGVALCFASCKTKAAYFDWVDKYFGYRYKI